jgi:ABC-type Mn2+/Zn2+ transport system ATPase subunit
VWQRDAVGDASDEREPRHGGDAVLELAGVRKRHRRQGPWVLDGVTLAVHPGQAVVIHGGNGSGKSTLVRLAAGLSRPSAGTHCRRGSASYLPERPAAAPPMTVRSYLRHLARLAGRRAGDAVREVDESIERHGLGSVSGRPMADLSKGWAQRVGLAGALLAQPELVLLDEPWSGVDDAGVAGMVRRIEEHRQAGGAFLITSHDPVPVDDPVPLLLRGGQLHEIGPAHRTHAAEPRGIGDGAPIDGREPGAPPRVVVLAAAQAAAPHLRVDELTALPGVLWLRPSDGGAAVRVAVEDGHLDAFVVRAINGGWSLRAVHAPGPEQLGS